MSYANRKFAYCVIPWTVDSCCLSPYHEYFRIESSVMNIVVCDTWTRWRVTLKHRLTSDKNRQDLFQLKRLFCEGGLRNYVYGEYVLNLYNGKAEEEVAYGLFRLKSNEVHESYFVGKSAELIHPLPSVTVQLKLHLVIYFDSATAPLPVCSNPYVKQLSEDMQDLYASEDNGYDILFETNDYIKQYLHKGILLNRLKREDLKQKIRESSSIRHESITDREAWEKTFLFLYTADMNIPADRPTSNVYHKALSYSVEPIIAYYEPEYFELHTRTEYEDLELTWTVADILSRTEDRLVSRRIIGKIGNGIMRLIKTTGDQFLINCDIGVDTERYLCIELLLKTETSEILLGKDHRRPWGGDVLFISKKILMCDFGNVPKGGCVTFKLLVRMSCIECEDDRKRLRYPSIGLSRIVRRPFCNEQNYIQLSDDLMSFYRSSKYFHLNIKSPVAMYTNEDEDYILRFRNERMADILFSAYGCYQGVFEPDVVRALIQFVFCAKLGETVGIEDSFKLIDIANECSFDTLGDALIDNLKKLLCNDNANEIYSLAESHNMLEFMDYMTSQENFPDLCRRLGEDLKI